MLPFPPDRAGACAALQSQAAQRGRGPADQDSSSSSRSSLGTLGGIADFVVMGKLGQGGYGTVFLARHKGSGGLVALKTLPKTSMTSANAAERVLNEAKVLKEARHPYIVQLHGVCWRGLNLPIPQRSARFA